MESSPQQVASGAEHVKDLIDGYSIHEVALTTWVSAAQPTTSYSEFRSLFAVDASDLAKAHYIIAEFDVTTRSEATKISTKIADNPWMCCVTWPCMRLVCLCSSSSLALHGFVRD